MAISVSNSSDIAHLMGRFRRGDKAAAGQLVELLYPELRRLAGSHMMREKAGHTWQPTALVNELYLELVKVNALRESSSGNAAERAAFFGLAATLMRRLLIHHARPLSKRFEKVELPDMRDESAAGAEALAQVEDALDRLSEINPKLRTVVEFRAFEGLTTEQTAERMGCGTATVTRQWSFAKQWLAEEFGNPQ